MLEINKIKNNADNIVLHLKKRGIDVSDKLSSVIDLDNARIANQQKLDALLAESNQIAQKIGAMAKDKKFNEIGPLKERASEIKLLSKELIEEGKKIEEKIKNNEDIFDRGFNLKKITIDTTYPKYIQKNKEKLKEWIV